MAGIDRIKRGYVEFGGVFDDIEIVGDEGQACAAPRRFPLNEHEIELALKDVAGAGPDQQHALRFHEGQTISNRDHVIIGFKLDNLELHAQ